MGAFFSTIESHMENSASSINAYSPPLYGYTPPPPQRPPSFPFGKIIVMILVFFILAGGASVAGYFYYINVPEKKIERMLLGLQKLQTIEYSGEFKVSQTYADSTYYSSPVSYYSTYRGKSDFRDPQNPSAVMAGGIRVESGSAETYALGGQVVIKDKVLYLHMTSLDVPDLSGMESESYVLLKNSWISVPLEGDILTSFTSMIARPGATQPNDTFLQILEKNREFFEKAYIKNQFMIINSSYPDEDIAGVRTAHYGVSIEPTKFIAFIDEVLPVLLNDSTMPRVDWQAQKDEINSLSDLLKQVRFDVWIGRFDDNLYKLSSKMNIPSTTDYGSDLDITFASNFSNHNKEFTVTAPEGAKSIEEFMKSSSVVSSSTLARSRDSTRFSDLSTLRKAIDARLADGSLVNLPFCAGDTSVERCTSYSLTNLSTLRDAGGSGWIPIDVSDYLATLPVDPSNGTVIQNSSGNSVVARYFFRSEGDTYKLATYLEDPNNKSRAENDGGTDPDLFETGTDLSDKNGI
jgi:hypothetical protein